MAIQLYDLTVATFLQTLGGVSGFLDRGLAHCRDNNIDPEEIVETRLHGDMLPFRFQLISVAHHSAGAIAGAKLLAWAEAPGLYWALRHDPNFWFGGKTIVGGLLGGWAGIELVKWLMGITASVGNACVFPGPALLR